MTTVWPARAAQRLAGKRTLVEADPTLPGANNARHRNATRFSACFFCIPSFGSIAKKRQHPVIDVTPENAIDRSDPFS
jgi:hypothetical protein